MAVRKSSLLATGAFALLSTCMSFSASATEMLSNGGFETGDFSSWSAISNGGTGGCSVNLWSVNATGAHGCTNNGTVTPAPTSGTYAAYNTFDGVGGAPFLLSQSFALPSSVSGATLSFLETYNMSHGGLLRTFQIDLFDATNTTFLANLFSVQPGGSDVLGWTSQSLDVTGLVAAQAGQTVTLRLSNIIPESYTGPAGFGVDDISLDVTSVPEPATFALMGLGLAGLAFRKKKQA